MQGPHESNDPNMPAVAVGSLSGFRPVTIGSLPVSVPGPNDAVFNHFAPIRHTTSFIVGYRIVFGENYAPPNP